MSTVIAAQGPRTPDPVPYSRVKMFSRGRYLEGTNWPAIGGLGAVLK